MQFQSNFGNTIESDKVPIIRVPPKAFIIIQYSIINRQWAKTRKSIKAFFRNSK